MATAYRSRLTPRDLGAWLDALDPGDDLLRAFAADVAMLVGRGAHPRSAAAGLLRLVGELEAADREKTSRPSVGWRPPSSNGGRRRTRPAPARER